VLRLGGFLVLLAMLGSGLSAWGQTEANRHPQVVVSVYNDAGIAMPIVRRAEQEVVKIFLDAGVRIEWSGSVAREDSAESGSSGDRGTSRRLAVRIVARSRSLSADVFGVAFLGADGDGQQADVFYENVAALSGQSGRNPGEVLGCVMAHELGHLVLGSSSHSADGLMRPHWDSKELKKMSMGRLRFEPGQTAEVRSRLGRWETNRSTTILRAGVNSRYPLP
jgi:hypothetical protein